MLLAACVNYSYFFFLKRLSGREPTCEERQTVARPGGRDMRGEFSLPFGVLGIPWGYIPGVLLLGERGLRGLSNLSDAHPV
jgi:hypothetical protein